MYVSTYNSNLYNNGLFRIERNQDIEKNLINYLTENLTENRYNSNFKGELQSFLKAGNNIDSLFKICKSYMPSHANICSAISMLHIGAYCNHGNAVEELLANNASPNTQLLDGLTPLHLACEKNSVESVDLLLKYYANPDTQSLYGSTPLHYACKENNIESVSLLLKYNANTKIHNKSDWSPMAIACAHDNYEIANALIQADPTNINIKSLKNKETPLISACKNNKEETALFLINKGADVNLQDDAGWQAIHYASYHANENLFMALLNKGADINSKVSLFKGRATPLIAALANEKYNFAESLVINHGASIHGRGICKVAKWFHFDGRHNSICCYLICAPCDFCFSDKDSDDDFALAKRTVCLCLQPSVEELAGEEFMIRVKSRLNSSNDRRNTANNEQVSATITSQPESLTDNKATTSGCFSFLPSFSKNSKTEVIYIGYAVGEAPPAYSE